VYWWWGRGELGGASDIAKAKSCEDPRATGGLVSDLSHPQVKKTNQNMHTPVMTIGERCGEPATLFRAVSKFLQEIRVLPDGNTKFSLMQICSHSFHRVWCHKIHCSIHCSRGMASRSSLGWVQKVQGAHYHWIIASFPQKWFQWNALYTEFHWESAFVRRSLNPASNGGGHCDQNKATHTSFAGWWCHHLCWLYSRWGRSVEWCWWVCVAMHYDPPSCCSARLLTRGTVHSGESYAHLDDDLCVQ